MMDKQTAMEFLRQHQPMPSDDDMTQEEVEMYEQAVYLFDESMDPDLIPLFINSPGEGWGYEMYESVRVLLGLFPSSEVVPHLLVALRSSHASVREWAATFSINFDDPDLVGPLSDLLVTDENSITRAAAAWALGCMDIPGIESILQDALRKEESDWVCEQIKECLEERGKKRRE